MSRPPLPTLDDRNDPHESRYTTSLRQRLRREQASAYHNQLRDYSRPSSSSGSALSGAPSLRRRARFETRPSTLRSTSADSFVRQREPEVNTTRPRRALTTKFLTSNPHPAVVLSKRTKAAISYAIEEAIRKPNRFTPVPLEENAQMSELSAQAANGFARTTGPVPVTTSSTSASIRPPTEIMRARNEREARRQREEEQKRIQEEMRRRESAERRAGSSAIPRYSASSSQYTPEASQQPFDDRRPRAGRVSGSEELGVPTGRAAQDYTTAVPGQRANTSRVDRTVPTTSSAARPAQPSQSIPRQPASSAPAPASSSRQPAADPSASRGGASSFPHAFERWETLSSHWEGLTSFWIRKLEQNTEVIRDTIPNAVTLNRQITDLSAAGANLFHAVVELQRLRASSERKFQRWFFDTRADGEKNRELQAQTDNQLQQERNATVEASRQAENARSEVAEMRRELMISKDEARRAWEELGRRNQESLEVAQSLKDGRVTLVHGVQVVPYMGGPSRSGSASQRPVTRDGQGYYGSTAGFASPGDEADYYYQQGEEASPTNTDPFMESNRDAPSQNPEYGTQPLPSGTYQRPYQVGGTPTTSSTAQTTIPATSQPPTRVTTQEAQRFYQHAPHEAFLHSPPPSSQPIGGGGQSAPTTRQDVQSEISYADTMSEGGTEYALDAGGNIQHDSTGRPIIVRQRARTNETDDDYDTEADILREQELSAQYGTGMPEAPPAPLTSATYIPTTSGPEAIASLHPDYEGASYGDWDTEPVQQTRHHHPTRLSDVLEEEEERSSRRTAD